MSYSSVEHYIVQHFARREVVKSNIKMDLHYGSTQSSSQLFLTRTAANLDSFEWLYDGESCPIEVVNPKI